MATSNGVVLGINSAARGASGTTAIADVTRARITPNVVTKVARGPARGPQRVFSVGHNAIVEIETESLVEYVAHLDAGDGVETLTIGFEDAGGNKKMQPTVEAAGGGPSDLPPRESSGNVPRYLLRFQVLAASETQTLTTALAITTDS